MLHRVFLVLALLEFSLMACDTPDPAQPADSPEAGDVVKPVGDAPPKRSAADRLAERRGMLAESRAIAEAYAAGTLGDRLVADGMLLVDAKAPANTDQTQFFVLNGPLAAPPAKVSELDGARLTDRSSVRKILLGGEDGSRPGLFREIAPGTYTVCAVVGPPTSAEKAAAMAKADALYKAEYGDKLDPENLKAIAEKVELETGYKAEAIDWDARPLRCKQVEVTAAADSRVVVLDGA